MQQQPDWYEVLKLAPDAATEQIEAAVERLSRQATALAVTAPERSQRLRDQVRAIKRDLLSGPESRERYDTARAAAAAEAAGPAEVPTVIPGLDLAPPVPPVPPVPGPVPLPAMTPPVAGLAPPVPSAPDAVPPSAAGPWPAADQQAGGSWPAAGQQAGGPWPAAGQQAGQGPWAAGQPGGAERMSSRIARFLRTGWTCASCGKEMLPSDKFCNKCGTPITPTRRDDPAVQGNRAACANCGVTLGVNDVFCSRCGTHV
jgi:hypothetical protein